MPVLLFLARTLLLPALSLLRYAIATPAKWLRKGWLAVAFLVYEGTIAATDMGFEKAVQDQRVRAGKMRVMQKALKDGKPYTGTDMQQIQLEAEARAKGEFWELAKAQTEYSVERTAYGLKEIASHPFAYRYSQIPKQFTDTYNQAVAMGVAAPAQLKGDSWDRQLDYSGYFRQARQTSQSFTPTWWSRRVDDVTHELRMGWDCCFGGASDSEGIRVGGEPLEKGQNPQPQAAADTHERARQKRQTTKKKVEQRPNVETAPPTRTDASHSPINEPQPEPIAHYDSRGYVDLDYENRIRIEAERHAVKNRRFQDDRPVVSSPSGTIGEPHVGVNMHDKIIRARSTSPYRHYSMKIEMSDVIVPELNFKRETIQSFGWNL